MTKIIQRSLELKSQSLHLLKFTNNIFQDCIISIISKLDFICPIIFLIVLFDVNPENFA
ncbi:MAG: hypothetical protein LBQ59_02695 [Candidatus Peribacteria bacterium]|nr:hypothetical protein [Candidatus Peribacteria bacterium]